MKNRKDSLAVQEIRENSTCILATQFPFLRNNSVLWNVGGGNFIRIPSSKGTMTE